MALPSIDQMDHDVKQSLAKLQNKLHLQHGYDLKIQCHSLCGFAADEIQLFTQQNAVDLIVMGMRGTGFIEEKLVGSVTTSVIAKVKVPVLVIDKETKFKRPSKLVLATDYEVTEPASLTLLKEFAINFNSHIYVLNIMPVTYEVPTIKEAAEGVKLDQAIEGTDHSFHYAENENIVEGINHFVKKHNADMLVMVAREHSFLHKLFHESTTKRMAFRSAMPMLALHQ